MKNDREREKLKMRHRKYIAVSFAAAALMGLIACGGQSGYQEEIIAAWTKTNQQESAVYSYEQTYINAEGASASSVVEGAYNRAEETWSQIASYGTQSVGKSEAVYSPDGIYYRYDLDGEGWGAWTAVEGELPDYAAYLTTLFEQEISFENIADITREEQEGEYLYTLTYEESYMEDQVEEELTATESYLEVEKDSSISQEELKVLEEKVENLRKMAGATGTVLYYVDKEGNLTGMGSRMTMEDGSGTGAMLRLSELGQVTFEGYTGNP